MADAEDPLKNEGGRWRNCVVEEILFHLTVFGIRPSVNRQGKETGEPTAAYTTEELSWGVVIPGEGINKVNERLLQKLFLEEASV